VRLCSGGQGDHMTHRRPAEVVDAFQEKLDSFVDAAEIDKQVDEVVSDPRSEQWLQVTMLVGEALEYTDRLFGFASVGEQVSEPGEVGRYRGAAAR